MKRSPWVSSIAVATLMTGMTGMTGGCTQATPEQQIVNDAAAALGGRDKILAVKTLVIERGGTNGNLGQETRSDATRLAFTSMGYKRTIVSTTRRVQSHEC